MSRPAVRTLCVVVLVLFAVLSGAVTPGAAQSTQTIAGTQLSPDDVSLRVDVHENGSAVWEVEYRVLLDDENATAAFESVRADVEANESQYASAFRDRMASTAATAENSTGREMSVRNVTVSASRQQLPQEYGVLTYRFVWVDFAVVEGDTIRAGDALEGLFLDEGTSLLVTWPEEYVLSESTPTPDDERSQTVVWNGPFDFGPGEPSLTLSRRDAGTTGAAQTDEGMGETARDGSSGDSSPFLIGAGLFVGAVAVAGGWLFYRRRGDVSGARATRPDDGRGGTEAGSDTAAVTAGGGASGAVESAAGAGDSSSPEDARADDADADGTDDVPPWEDELLSNEERVLALIEHEGGRLKQQEVAQTLDWTDAKTSQVVRRMRDDDELDAFRLGRENVLVLPDEDIEPDRD
ncbi:helix-turn-helix transcriptional regulator [Halogeometricum limi]|uniref:IclR helix-turn-helix domain-containing protein n=1 Tax=Halogeometricum limi TaxID=555875 RepID=A0A1I6HXT2_9EURY|nr:hypothetical protein [Halogeometricum limi]SFR59275.1 hypothetical protein SAMN04488124_2586 [Halogeometricum limi]